MALTEPAKAQRSFFWGLGGSAGGGYLAYPSGIKDNLLLSGGHLYFRKDFQDDYRDFMSVAIYPGIQIQPPLAYNADAGDTMILSIPMLFQYSRKKEPANFTYGGMTYFIGVGLDRMQKLGSTTYWGPALAVGFRHFMGNQTYELHAGYTRDYQRDSRIYSLRFTLMFGHD